MSLAVARAATALPHVRPRSAVICMRSCPTWHGIRVIIGDVRGKGLDAILLARYVLSAFRRSAVAVPAMEQQGVP
jgi:hypothetical protein